MRQSVIFRDLGQMDYKTAWDYQENLLQQNVNIKSAVRSREFAVDEINGGTTSEAYSVHTLNSELTTQNYLLFVEHPPVFTLGKSGNINNVLLSEERLNEKGIEFFRTNRGGDITFHGPFSILKNLTPISAIICAILKKRSFSPLQIMGSGRADQRVKPVFGSILK
jgi:lipoyl(octanoyl) transferase